MDKNLPIQTSSNNIVPSQLKPRIHVDFVLVVPSWGRHFCWRRPFNPRPPPDASLTRNPTRTHTHTPNPRTKKTLEVFGKTHLEKFHVAFDQRCPQEHFGAQFWSIHRILRVSKEAFGTNRENYFLSIFFVFFATITKTNEEKERKTRPLCGLRCHRWNWLNMKVAKNRSARRIWKSGNFSHLLEHADLLWNPDLSFLSTRCSNGVPIRRKPENPLHVFLEAGTRIDRTLRTENDTRKML
jgi:hypothetical protein